MKTLSYVLIAILGAAICDATAATPLERKLLDMRTTDPTREQLAQLYQLRTNAPNANVQATVVKACATGLCYLGQTESYSRLRSSVEQVDALEASMSVPCERCAKQRQILTAASASAAGSENQNDSQSGFADNAGSSSLDGTSTIPATQGKIITKCTACKGVGKCSVSTCRDGRRTLQGFNGNSTEGICPACNGTGRCLKCEGSGSVLFPCSSCKGKGAIFSKSAALEQFKTSLEQAIGVYEQNRKEALARVEKLKREADQITHERKMREVEVGAKKEAILIEAQTAGAERAKQDAARKAKEIEQKLQEEENAKLALRDNEFLKSCVLIQGDRGAGSGFVVNFKGKKVVMSNAHVLCGNRRIKLVTTAGKELRHTKIYVCKKENLLKDINDPNFEKYRDVVIYEIENANDVPALALYDIKKLGLSNQERVAVFGNSHGQNVATTLRGNVKGSGPDIVEIDTTFVQGNSGGPIIAYNFDSVIGMVTFMKNKPNIDWTNRSSSFVDVRYFGVRVDNIDWSDFDELDMDRYNLFLDTFEQIVTFASAELPKIEYRGSRYYPAPTAVKSSKELLAAFHGVPEWISSYADDARLGAHICAFILSNQ